MYWSSAGGTWFEERASTAVAGGYDGQPSIAIGPAGSLLVAFARFRTFECFEFACGPGRPLGIQLISRGPDGWTEAETVAEGPGYEPFIARNENDVLIAYVFSGTRRQGVFLSSPSGEGWAATELAPSGDTPVAAIERSGTVHVVFAVYDEDSGDFDLEHAVRPVPGQPFATQPGPTVRFFSWPVFHAAIDPDDNVHVLGDNRHWQLLDEGWTDPQPIFDHPDGGVAGGIAVGADGVIHVVSEVGNCVPVLYAAGGTGGFETQQVSANEVACSMDGPVMSEAIAVDPLGSIHIIYTELGEEGVELWYALGELP